MGLVIQDCKEVTRAYLQCYKNKLIIKSGLGESLLLIEFMDSKLSEKEIGHEDQELFRL